LFKYFDRSLSKLFGLLVPFEEKSPLLLFIVPKHLWIKVSGVKCSGVISPSGHVGIIEWSVDWLIVLLFPHLELLWHGSVGGLLQLLDLVTGKAVVTKDLPLLGLTFVGIDLALDDLGLANDLFDPVLEFHEHLFHSGRILETSNTSVLPRELLLIVVIVVVMLSWGEVMSHLLHVGLLRVPNSPESITHL
jgi:hypothetical protein